MLDYIIALLNEGALAVDVDVPPLHTLSISSHHTSLLTTSAYDSDNHYHRPLLYRLLLLPSCYMITILTITYGRPYEALW
jgi:hypothetical protein